MAVPTKVRKVLNFSQKSVDDEGLEGYNKPVFERKTMVNDCLYYKNIQITTDYRRYEYVDTGHD